MRRVLPALALALLAGLPCCSEDPPARGDGGSQPDRFIFHDHSRPAPDLPRTDGPWQKLDKGTTKPDVGKVDAASKCASGESYYGGHCYRVTGIKYISWATGKTMCQGQTPPMELVTITSAGENQFVFNLLPALNQTAWIGLKRTGSGATDFAWDSGNPVTYWNWASGEPSNDGGIENCVLMWGPHLSNTTLISYWNDMPCDPSTTAKVDAVICERVP